jgi:DNA helicase-4
MPKIKEIVKGTKDWIIQTYRLISIFNPFFDTIDKKMNIYEPINERFDKKIITIYEDLNNKRHKNIKEVNRYESTIEQIKLHNELIIFIENNIKNFNYSKILENPSSVSSKELSLYKTLIDKINHFTYRTNYTNETLAQLLDVNTNLSTMIEQYNLLGLYNDTIEFIPNSFIDQIGKERLIEKIKPLIKVIRSSKQKYYDFSKLSDIDQFIVNKNSQFIENNLQDSIFTNVNSLPLDLEQRRSILTDEINTIVIAGAGSGKTTTITGKVKYLLEKKKIPPEEILILSYTRKSANDLNNKLHKINNQLKAKTFHELGLEMIKKFTKSIDINIREDNKKIIDSYFSNYIQDKPEEKDKVLTYFAYFQKSSLYPEKLAHEGDLYAHLKTNEIPTIKSMIESSKKEKRTINKELVKSFEEVAIANFYFLNGIKYTYEKPYEHKVSSLDKREYRPDFYLQDYKIYHEHYGVDQNGLAKQYTNDEAKKYIEGIKWKKQIHAQNQTSCIETYSYLFGNGTIFDDLKAKLLEKSVEIKPISSEHTFNILKSIYDGVSYKSFIQLMVSFINLYKSKYTDEKAFEKLMIIKQSNPYEKQRTKLFLDIAKNVYKYYRNVLVENSEIDFDDMISKATIILRENPTINIQYIIVDEFQDISFSRMKLLSQIKVVTNAKMFVVGDDWQSIFRFAGSDLDIFVNFQKYFGTTSKILIQKTFRNSFELQKVAGDFIQKNPYQISKSLITDNHLEKPIKIIYYDDNKYDSLQKAFYQISKINDQASILLLGRNNHDIDAFLSDRFFKLNEGKHNKQLFFSRDFPKFHLSYSTIHQAKGLEDQFSIILNNEDSTLGFPNKIEDDSILNLVLSNKDNYIFGEERRLFYVALTRTKSFVYLLVNSHKPSIFIQEIIQQCDVLNSVEMGDEKPTLCPYCKTGHLVSRNNNTIYGCTNYPYCNYIISDFKALNSQQRCPECNDFMTKRRGRFGSFYGCHSYPFCKHTENINLINIQS